MVVLYSDFSELVMEDIPYDVGASEGVQKVDDELKNDLADLKSELEDQDVLHSTVRNARYSQQCAVFCILQ